MMQVPSAPSPECGTPVLVVTASSREDDHCSLRAICSDCGWTNHEARSCRDALSLARRRPIQVVICARDLPGGGWEAVLDGLAELPHRPRLIVSSRLADHRLWADVLSLGGYDVLATPFDAGEVARAVTLAWHSSKQEVGRARFARRGATAAAIGA